MQRTRTTPRSRRGPLRRQTVVPLVLALSLGAASCGTRLSDGERSLARSGGAQTVSATARAADGGVGVTAPVGGAGPSQDASAPAGQDAAAAPSPLAGAVAATGPDGNAADLGTRGTSGPGPVATAASAAAPAGPGGGASAAAVAPAPGSPLLLGSVGTFSGPSGAAWKPGSQALKVWAKDVNSRGGVDGHPVRLLSVDDAGDPARHLAAVKDLVEDKKVFAFVYNVIATSGSPALTRYLEDHHVPVVGGDLASTTFETSRTYFPTGTTLGQQLVAHMAYVRAQKPGLKKIALLTCREAPACKQALDGWPALGTRYGFTTVYKAEVSIAQPDFTSECLGARNAGAEMLFVAVDPNSVRRVGASCSRQGYRPSYFLPSGVISSSQSGDPNLEGTLGFASLAPWMSSATPGQAAWQTARKRFAPGLETSLSSSYGWAAGAMFEAAVKGRLGKVPTREALLAGLYSFRGETLGGLTPPLTFVKGRRNAVPCYFGLVFRGGEWREGNGGRAACP